MACTSKQFLSWKNQSLSGVDFSRKGSIDEPIAEMVQYINGQADYFTTSSCSGRCIVVEEDESNHVQKKGCRWLYTTHDNCQAYDVEAALQKSEADAVFKFEPFIMHVQCRTIENAQLLHTSAVAAGFRNSGITIGKKGKIITAIRSTHGLEVPMTASGTVLVSSQYIAHVTQLANVKMEENLNRIQRFFSNIKVAFESASSQPEQKSAGKKKLRQKLAQCYEPSNFGQEKLDSTNNQNYEALDSTEDDLILDAIFDTG